MGSVRQCKDIYCVNNRKKNITFYLVLFRGSFKVSFSLLYSAVIAAWKDIIEPRKYSVNVSSPANLMISFSELICIEL